MTTCFSDAQAVSNSLSVSARELYRPFEALFHPPRALPAFDQPERTEERFQRLRAKWLEDTMMTSSTSEMVAHPAYLGIIGMGVSAVPCLLRDLVGEEPNHFWASALTAITGVNPVPEAALGDMDAIAKSWLDWGRLRGYLQP